MHSLARNRQKIFYALWTGETDIVDKNGNKTGTKKQTYSAPVEFDTNKSGGRGTAENDAFGANVIYDATLCTTDTNCPIDVHSIIWIDKDPLTEPYNYVVAAKPSVTLNSVLIAIREVDVKKSPYEPSNNATPKP